MIFSWFDVFVRSEKWTELNCMKLNQMQV